MVDVIGVGGYNEPDGGALGKLTTQSRNALEWYSDCSIEFA